MTPLLRKANDDKAFERLYQRHVKDVFRYSLAVLGETADAEDVTQTTFLNAYRAFQRGERPEKPENWLIAIAHNVCRQRFRQQQRRPAEVEFEDELGGAVERDEEGPTLDELRRAFAALPANQRAALVMRELEGRSYTEIAEVLGVTVSALETLLFRARRALREQLEEQLSCRDAAFALSKQLDGRLTAGERRALRAHLRGCPECARLAHSQRAQRKALRTLLAVPLPQSLQTFLPHAGEAAATGSAAAAGGTAIAIKAAAVVAAGTLVGGGAYEGAKHVPPLVTHHVAASQTVAHRSSAPRPVALAVLPAPKARPAPAPPAAKAAHAPKAAHPKPAPSRPAVEAQAQSPVEKPQPAAPARGNAAQAPGRTVSAEHKAAHAAAVPRVTKAKQAGKKKQHAKTTVPAVARRHGPAPKPHPKPGPKPKPARVASTPTAQDKGAGRGNSGADGRSTPGSTPSPTPSAGPSEPATTVPVAVPTVPDVTLPLPDALPTRGNGKGKPLPVAPPTVTLPS